MSSVAEASTCALGKQKRRPYSRIVGNPYLIRLGKDCP
jgi:hypothetical protein